MVATSSSAIDTNVANDDQLKRPIPARTLMDFAHFKATFNRHYESMVEEATRQRLFLARFLKACASQVKYQLGFTTSYSGINHLSDRTKDERERLVMRLKKHPELLVSGADNPLAGRKKGFKPFQTLYNYLIGDGKSPAAASGGATNPPAGYKHIKVVFGDGTQMSAAELGQTKFEALEEKEKELEGRMRNNKLERTKKDRVYHDLRKTGCFGPAKDQGNCGSCYIFTHMAILEYLYCLSTKKSTKFSEQFVVDCGHAFKLDGCDGGTFDGLAEFVHLLGLELEAWYPYRQRESQCPFIKGHAKRASKRSLMNSTSSGYMRVKFAPEKSNVPVRLWEACLASGIPLDVSLTIDVDKFSDYAGGTDQGGSKDDEYHSMTLVGSGREKGVDYWLLRNSFGPDWGVAGHYKLAKDSPVLEWPHNVAETYSVFLDGTGYDNLFELNKDYNHELVADKNAAADSSPESQ